MLPTHEYLTGSVSLGLKLCIRSLQSRIWIRALMPLPQLLWRRLPQGSSFCEEVASMLGQRAQLMATVCTYFPRLLFPLPFELQSFMLTSSGINLKGYYSCVSWFYCCRCRVQKQSPVSPHPCLTFQGPMKCGRLDSINFGCA